MNKPLKYSLIGGGVLLGAAVLAVAAFVATFDPNHYKDAAARAVKDATGRKLTIAGELELQLFPWLALRTGKVELGNATGFEGPFLTLAGSNARVKVMPLLRGEVEIGEVALEGADLRLAVDATGRDNWSDLLSAHETPDAADGGTPTRLSIARVVLSDARLAFTDARDGSTATITELGLRTAEIEPGAPLSIEGSLRFVLAGAAGDPPLAGKLGYAATVIPGEALRLTNLALDLDAKGGALPAPLEGARFTATQLAFGETIEFEGVHIAAWGLKLDGALTRAAVESGARTSGGFTVAEFAPREVLPRFGIAVPRTADPKVLASMSGSLQLEHLGDQLTLSALKFKLDQSTLTGRITLESIARKALRFDLALDAFDADRYLPPPATSTAPLEGGGFDAVALNVDWLRGLDAVGTLKAGKLAVAKFDLAELRVGVEARNGRLWLKPFGAALYGGKVQGEIIVDARGAVLAGELKLKLAGVQLHGLMADAFASKLVSGVATADLDLAGRGATIGALKQDLDGKVSFKVEDGAIEGFNVWKQVRLAWAKYKSRETAAVNDPDRTEFERLVGGATLADGVATLEGVQAAIRFAEATAKGRVDLAKGLLKVDAVAKINAVPDFGPGENLTDLNGVSLPLTISGPFAKPKVEVNVAKAAASMIKPELLKDEKLRKKLKDLFG